MRDQGHEYADENETHRRVSGSGPRPQPELPEALLEELVKGPMTPAKVQDLMLAFNNALIERTMDTETSMHLGYRPA